MDKTLNTITDHITCVQGMMSHILKNLDSRRLNHDHSKLRPDVFRGYMRFEDFPEGLEYGSDAYKEEMAKVMDGNDCFKIHAALEDHHPEHFEHVEDMGFLEIIEMVCDWAGATISYGNKGSFTESGVKNIERFGFTKAQTWLILQVADFLLKESEALQENEKLSELDG